MAGPGRIDNAWSLANNQSVNSRAESGPSLTAAPVVVFGLGRFGLRLVELLHEGCVPVTVVTDPRTRADHKQRARDLGAVVIEGDFRFSEVRTAAGVASARAVILASSFDAINLETALDLRHQHRDLRIVMRFDAERLAVRLQSEFGIDAVLSPALLAAPKFAAAAMEAAPPAPEGRRHLPSHHSIVGALAAANRLSPLDGRRETRNALVLLSIFFCVAVLVFHGALRLAWVDAVYFAASVVTTTGFGDFNLQAASAPVKLFGVALMFSGVTMIAVISSMLTNFLLSGQSIQRRVERTARRLRGHVIVCGLGGVGFEVARDLQRRRVPLVIIDATPDDLQVRMLKDRVPILIGDASNPDTLLRAGLSRARAVTVVTSDDAVNLEIVLVAQSLAEELRPDQPLRLVLRCFDPDLAVRLRSLSAACTPLSAAEIAAPRFVHEALGTASDVHSITTIAEIASMPA
jgi:voltage-gated potassium channel Kch